MAFEGLDISIGGDSAGAKGAIASVKSSLGELKREANDAQDSVEELGDEATQTSTSLTTLGATAGASVLTLLGLSSAATGATTSLTALTTSAGTVTVALVGLAAVAGPLVATLGAATAAAGGLATAFGAVVGSGLLAFGQEQAETMDEASTATEALAQTAADLKAEIEPLVVDLGEQFVPLIEDAVDAIPELAEEVINALGPLDEFADALREAGSFAAEALPALVEVFVDLGREALPVVEQLAAVIADDANSAFEGMVDVAERVGDDLLGIADAAGDLIPDLTELGVTIIEGAAPAVESLIGFVDDLIEGFNDFARSSQSGAIFREIKQEIIPLIPRVQGLFAEFKPLLDALLDNLPQIIDLFGGFADSVLDIANTVIPVIVPPLSKLIDLIGDVSGALAKWIERSDEGRDKISSDALFLKSTYEDVVAGVQNALSRLRQFTAEAWNLNPLSDTFEAVAAAVVGDGDSAGIIPALESDVRDTFNSLREHFATQWDLSPLSDAFDAVVDAIGDAFGRLDFGSFESALDSVAGGVRSLIDSLNELSGVNIDVDVPSFDDLLDEAKEIVEPEEEEKEDGDGPYEDPATDDDGNDRGNRPPDDDDPGIGGGDDDDSGGGAGGQPGSKDPDANEGGDDGDPLVGLSTGGFVESAGAAMLHAGERVVPEAQIADRGPAPVKGGGGITIENLTVNASGRTEGREAGKALKRELKRFDI